MANSMREVDRTIKSRQDAIEIMKEWFSTAGGSAVVWEDDKKTMLWLQENTAILRNNLLALEEQVAARELGSRFTALLHSVAENRSGGPSLDQLLSDALAHMPASDRTRIKDAILNVK